MIDIIRWTIWQRRWSIMWWCIGVVGFVALELAFYPTFRNQAGQLNHLLDQLPPAARGFISDSSDFFSPVGYLSTRLFSLLMPIFMIVLSIGLGSSLIAREERDGTIELLLSRPLSRNRLLAGKAVAGICTLGIVAVSGLVSIIVMDKLVGIHVNPLHIAGAVGMGALLSLCFGALALLITCLGGPARLASVGLSTFLAFAGYILNSLDQVVHWLRAPARVLPFNYYHPTALVNGIYYWRDVVYMLGVAIGCYIVAWLAFRRRDIGV